MGKEIKDYFDRVCTFDSTVVVTTDASVQNLWDTRYIHYNPVKINHSKEFYDSFEDLIIQVHENREIDIQNLDYWDYIKMYHKAWNDKILTQQSIDGMTRMIQDGINLYHNIKENGMLNPIGIIIENGNMIIYRGCRRLVILHVLGVERLKVKYAIVDNSSCS